jgi:hypothetical protein
MDEEFDDIFDWASDVYDNPEESELSQYQCSYSIEKTPDGEETLSHLTITKTEG